MSQTSQTRFCCPCCGYLTLTEEPPGTYQICPVCAWEDDLVQFDDPGFEGGANTESLREAKQNFMLFGASNKHLQANVRGPSSEEIPPPTKFTKS